jgi:Transposase DDE domain
LHHSCFAPRAGPGRSSSASGRIRPIVGERVSAASPIRVEIVTGPPYQIGFIVQKRRWVVERTFAWIGRNRRLARDYERHASTALSFVFLAAAWVHMNRVSRLS